MKSERTALLAPVAAFVCLIGLNVVEREPGRIWWSGNETGFAEARGWPLIAVATANDDGAEQIDASVTQGDTHVERNVLGGAYPHLAWNTFSIVIDVVVAVTLVLATLLIARKVVRGRRRSARRTDSPSVHTGQ